MSATSTTSTSCTRSPSGIPVVEVFIEFATVKRSTSSMKDWRSAALTFRRP